MDRPDAASDRWHEMPGHFEPFAEAQEKVSLLEGVSDSTITGGTFNAAGRDIVNTTTTTTVNNIIINFLDGKPLSDADILEWLSAINYRAIQMDNFDKVTPDTCSWFLQSEIFLQWLLSQEGIIWGTGMPGSGKTLLASIVINHLQEQAKLRGPKIALAFAYCRYTSPVPVRQILAALIRQLLERYPFLLPLVQPLYEEHRREKTKPSRNELLDLLRDISNVFDTFYCALDGLDEATEDDQFKLLDALSSIKANFFITSRPLESLSPLLPNARFFTVAARDEDIQRLIDYKIKQSPRLVAMLDTQGEGSSHRETIVTKITQKAEGMFLHAALQVETLQQSLSLRHALDNLDQLPTSIEDMYARTMKRIDMQPRASSELARRILTWVVFAHSLLKVEDLQYALAVNIVNQPIPAHGEILDRLALIDGSTLLSVCCGLIIVDSSSGNVRLIHFTALEYLKRELGSFRTEVVLGKTCIRRVICEGFLGEPFNVLRVAQDAHSYRPFFEYSLKHWITHSKNCFSLAKPLQEDILQDIVQLIIRCPWLPANWGQNMEIQCGWWFESIDPLLFIIALLRPVPGAESSDSPNPANPADSKLSSLEWAVDDLISRIENAPAYDINRTSTHGGEPLTALTFAVSTGNIHVVQRLLTCPGIDINPGKNGYIPLTRALEGRRLDIADILLEHTIRIGAHQTPSGGVPLFIAAMHPSNERIVRKLLTFPHIDVNQTGGPSDSTALLVAASRGLDGVVAALLKHPNIDINRKDKLGWTALIQAVEDEHNSVAFQLIKRAELDPNVAGPRGGCTALMTAAWLDNVEVTRHLLDHPRIQVNAVDETGQTALAHALHCGHLEVAKAILASQEVNINLERPSDGLTPLMMGAMLAESSTSGLFPMLLQYPGIDVNQQTKEGVTALMLAAYHGNIPAVRSLLEVQDIDASLKTDQGATALEFSHAQGHKDIVELLRAVE
ncbi:ankyrin repeat-containing domain protein [Coprinopsis sp. MPI-PUGE-AT-0042]|nr:ankyrin repeat-containing domain protein [Coprinopsis sp. MPI-PUGE-AT-0042]